MTVIDVKATHMKLDPKTFQLTYETDIGPSRPGILLNIDDGGARGLMITNQFYNGDGPVYVKMLPFKTPAKKYEVGEIIAKLIIL